MKYPVSDLGALLHNGKFTDGIPGEGVDASIDKARDMNAVYDELIAVILDGPDAPSESVLTQVRDSIRWQIAQAIATRAATSHGHVWSQISNIPATFPPAAHNQDWNTITGKPATYPPSEHSHNYAATAGNADQLDGYHAADILAACLPTLQGVNPSLRGYFHVISTGGAIFLPAGGTWSYYVIGFFPNGGGREAFIGIAAGGSQLNLGGNGMNYGFAIKVA